SMMYFLVSTPPKISCMVRPAFSATSVKLAMGLAGVFVCWLSHQTPTNRQAEPTMKQPSFAEIIRSDVDSDGMRFGMSRSVEQEQSIQSGLDFHNSLTAQPYLPPRRYKNPPHRSRTSTVAFASPSLRRTPRM